jgi:hypothetical protein
MRALLLWSLFDAPAIFYPPICNKLNLSLPQNRLDISLLKAFYLGESLPAKRGERKMASHPGQ